MIPGLARVLVVGGGIGGMAATIGFLRAGVAVELIDIDPDWKVYGAGITITGSTLRAYRQLGLLDRLKTEGAITSGTRLRHFSGAVLAEMDEPVIEDGLPATGGILRPVLHRIMSDEVRRLGAEVRLGITITKASSDGSGVEVTFSDGRTGRYDLLIAADGIYSKVRSLLFPHAVEPRYTGQAAWRVLADRPAGFDRGEFYIGHHSTAGITACSPSQVYMWVLETDPERRRVEPADQAATLISILKDYGGVVGTIRDGIDAASSIVYRPLEAMIQPKPWYVGRSVLIGDAAHATTPHLASGAGMAVEDALVLVEELVSAAPSIENGLAAFTERRFERCRFVVETSVAIGDRQIGGSFTPEVDAMVGKALHQLAEPF